MPAGPVPRARPRRQKRNKTSSGVRLVHLPTGTVATATEDRSLRVNKIHALRRLKLKLAAEHREPIDLLRFEPPEWFLSVRVCDGIQASDRHPLYAAVGGLVLDLLPSPGRQPRGRGRQPGRVDHDGGEGV